MSTESAKSAKSAKSTDGTENTGSTGGMGGAGRTDRIGTVRATEMRQMRNAPGRAAEAALPERPHGRSRGLGGRREPHPFVRRLVTLVAVLVVIAVVRSLVVQSYTIPSGSMENTLHAGDRIMVTVYDAGSVERGDVVVFTDPDNWLTEPGPTGVARVIQDVLVAVRLLPENAGHHLVKRVVGLPGDHIVADGTGPMSVNGIVLDEPYLKPGRTSSDIAFDVTVPDGYVWVMGDNRSNSADSRVHRGDAHGGFVPAGNIVGTARFVYWPIGRWSGLGGGRDVFSRVPEAASAPVTTPAPAVGEH